MKKKRRHLTPDEIKAQLNQIAKEKRMCDRSPWTAMGIMCGYVIMRKEGFKGRRISKIASKVNEYEEQWNHGDLTVEEVCKQLMDKAGWTVKHTNYTEADIYCKKGSYDYWLSEIQLAPMNVINEQATRYVLFFFRALMEEYGFGKERLTRVHDYMNELLLLYQTDKTTVREWQQRLYEEAGIVFEMPVDPLYHGSKSMLTGF